MLIRQLYHYESGSFSYLLACKQSHQAVLIDPVLEQGDLYLQLLEQLDLSFIYSIESHIHADHVSCASWLKSKTNCKLLMPQQSNVDCCDDVYTEGSNISFGNHFLECIYTPGHTDDSYCLYSADHASLFSGDTLLIRGSGRTDFENSDPCLAYASLKKLQALPDETCIYPAHDYQGLNVSTMYEEKLFNPRMQFSSQDAFVEHMKTQGEDMPKLFDIAIKANLNCGQK